MIGNLSIFAAEADEEKRRKRALLDFARFQGWTDDRITKLTEILQRKTVDEAAEEFRKLQEEPTNQMDHRLVESEAEMMKLLEEGWEIDRELNGGGRFIMKRRA